MNVAADSGNTPLHAAVNRGDVEGVRELLNSSAINVNAVNPECGDVTPLLLAAMHGLFVVHYNVCSTIEAGQYLMAQYPVLTWPAPSVGSVANSSHSTVAQNQKQTTQLFQLERSCRIYH